MEPSTVLFRMMAAQCPTCSKPGQKHHSFSSPAFLGFLAQLSEGPSVVSLAFSVQGSLPEAQTWVLPGSLLRLLQFGLGGTPTNIGYY